MDVQFYTDAQAFLRESAPFLAADPVRCSVVATMAQRLASAEPTEGLPRWFATVSEGGQIVSVAMRTHPDPPHAGFVPQMASGAVSALAEALQARGEHVIAWNGDLEAGQALCARVAEGRPVAVQMHTRLFECRTVIWPVRPAGQLRLATLDDEDLVARWSREFHRDSEAQGGRTPDPAWEPPKDAVRAVIAAGERWLWEVDGVPVHVTGAKGPAFGVTRIGPVYTPPEHRGKGYAGWVVAVLTQKILDEGARPCLYTDQANPISNKVYERIGYVAVGDEANTVVLPGRNNE